MTRTLEGRGAIVTGASMGLGRAIAQAYLAAGANVLICARDGQSLESTADALRQPLAPGQALVAEVADVTREEDTLRVVNTALKRFRGLEILVNNAGGYGPFGPIEDVDWGQWVRAVESNLFGSVLMARAVLPHFKRQRYGKIVQISGGGATAPLPRISAYAASKAAVVRFAESLAGEVREDGIDVNAIAPGALNTRLLGEVLAAGPDAVGQEFYERSVRQHAEGGTPLERGAELAVFLASALSDGITGKLLSAVWDAWAALPEHREALQTSDVYTLRRIVPSDRGLDW